MASQVRVQDVSELQGYGSQLQGLKDDLLSSASQLARLADEIESTASSMKAATDGQESNWSDPQYTHLKEELDPVIASVSTTANSMTDTATVINTKMSEVQESIDYIARLVAKLNDI